MMGRSRDAEAELNLPPGFRFHPTDEELVFHYLCRKATHQFLPVPIIAEVDLYKYDPWQLPELALFGQKEWYFFTPRDRKYPNGSRPNRAAGTGYWKATGADKPVALEGGGKPLGIKKALVFYTGKAPRGEKTNWIMHEYRLADVNRSSTKNGGGSLRLDDWVLCRLYHKKNNWGKERQQYQQKQQTRQKSEQTEDGSVGDTMDSFDTVEEVASVSHRIAESEIYNDEYAEIAGKTNSRLNDMVVSEGNNQVGESIKDDNSNWYMDLCLDDLQSSFSVSAFGSGLKTDLEMPLHQDFSFSNLMSPASSSQINLLNF